MGECCWYGKLKPRWVSTTIQETEERTRKKMTIKGERMTREELHKEFELLREQAIRLRTMFNTFNYLFDSGCETKDILIKSASLFFHDINDMMQEYIILLVCRLTDPPETSGKSNLTIPHMNELLRETNCLSPEIEALSNSIMAYRKLLEPVRNKIVSHNDHKTHISESALGGHTEEEMMQFFDNDLQGYFDAVGNAVGVGPLYFRATPGEGDVLDLIRTLKKGLGLIPIQD